MTITKLMAWRKASDDCTHTCKLDKIPLNDQPIEIRDFLEQRIGVDPNRRPHGLLDDI